MSATILLVGFFLALADWLAVARRIFWLEYMAKPTVMLSILGWLFYHAGLCNCLNWFLAGAACSLCGDIALMLPTRRFVTGMAFFSLAYLAYAAGFMQISFSINPALLMMGGFVLLPVVAISQRLLKALVAQRQRRLVAPTIIYSAILSLLLVAASSSLSSPDWAVFPAILASSGALLLFLSDAFLAWNQYIHPFHQGRLINIIPYHLGQLLIAYSVVIQSLA